VLYIIPFKDSLLKTRFLAIYNNVNFIKNDKVLKFKEVLGNGQPERLLGLCLRLYIV